jgi:hypothetical protein
MAGAVEQNFCRNTWVKVRTFIQIGKSDYHKLFEGRNNLRTVNINTQV